MSLSKGRDQGLKDSGHMWPARTFCAGRNAFWEFSDNKSLRYLGYSPVFKSARLWSEQVPLKRMLRRLEMICLELLAQEIRCKSCF